MTSTRRRLELVLVIVVAMAGAVNLGFNVFAVTVRTVCGPNGCNTTQQNFFQANSLATIVGDVLFLTLPLVLVVAGGILSGGRGRVAGCVLLWIGTSVLALYAIPALLFGAGNLLSLVPLAELVLSGTAAILASAGLSRPIPAPAR